MPRLFSRLDRFLDSLTSYRLVLYSLMAYVIWAAGVAVFNQLPFKWYEILLSAAWLVIIW